jgi:glucokinase
VVLAVDIGGTKMAVGVVDPAGDLVVRDQRPTPGATDAETMFGELTALITSVLARASDEHGLTPTVCGAGCGGPMTRGGEGVSPLNIPAWRDFPLRSRLADATGLDTFVDNDAKALALGEGWKGAAAGCRDFVGMVVSTGVGGGIVLDGRLLDGADGNAGHIGHISVDPSGHPCVCGAVGCLEAEASGTAIQTITGIPPRDATAEVVVRTGTMVGRAVAAVANLLDLRLAVVAGSVALGFGEPFFAAAQAEIARQARLDFSVGTTIVPGGLGSEGPLVGAAAVAHLALGRPVLG